MAESKGVHTREKLLEAANRLVREQGVNRLTMDAVAREAGVSKGGLLYHFASKEALIQGMIDHLIHGYDRRLDSATKGENRPGEWLRAFVLATDWGKTHADRTGALLAAAASNPELLDPVRRRYRAWQERLEQEGNDPAMATIIRLAADGLWFADLFGLAPPEGRFREEVIRRMLQLLEQSGSTEKKDP